MDILAYLVVTAFSPDELQKQCNDIMHKEEVKGDIMYVYEPLGAPIIDKDMDGFSVFIQTFTLQMLFPMDEPEQPRLDS